MKIAIVIERYAPEAGGAERSTAEVAEEMQSRGHGVTILTGQSNVRGGAAGVNMRISPYGAAAGFARLLMFRRWARREIREGGYDASLSVTSMVPAMVVQPRAGLLPDLQQRSLAWNERSAFLWHWAQRLNWRRALKRRLERKTFSDPEVRWIACISQMLRRDGNRHYPEVAGKLVHVCNAVKPLVVPPGEAERWRAARRGEWGVGAEDTLFFLPSMDSRRKGLTPLLRALARVRKETPEARAFLILCGRVHETQQRMIRELGLAPAVRQIGFHNDLRPFYCATDVTVLPSYYDSFGRVVTEALLLGRPAITTAFAGAAELVAPPAGPPRGRVVADPDDTAALAKAMRELCDAEERRRCVAAIGGALESYTTQRHVDALLALFAKPAANGG